ncbi:hypothetical protein N0V84_012406 [Fusarium piperis]|uniref:F-box domain-containing protein n=1 Tax=Fusarium piperis TaxID=1435070 RepID=A0A9W8TBI8_9HYPO|nr:hypothetical protein N0V84_012406 [Fusarium piperis]
MDKLPYALISLIVSCLLEDDEGNRKPWSKPPPIALYASISRSWQDGVEMHTFSHVKVRSDEFSRFETAFCHMRRRRAVSTIDYDIVLPPYSQARCWKFERPHEHAENMAVFSRAVHAIISSLHAWQTDEEAVNGAGAAGSGCRPIQLKVRAESRLDSSSLQRQGIGLYRMGGHFLDFTEPWTPGTPESENDDLWWPDNSRADGEVDNSGYASDDSWVRDPFDRRNIHRNNGTSPLNNWRSELDPSQINPLVLALSRAICCMPVLGELDFYMGMSDIQGPSGIVLNGEAEWDVAPVLAGNREIEHIKRRCWKAEIGCKAKWEPPGEVFELWRRFVGPGGDITVNERSM